VEGAGGLAVAASVEPVAVAAPGAGGARCGGADPGDGWSSPASVDIC
jgi:hypothetical protein